MTARSDATPEAGTVLDEALESLKAGGSVRRALADGGMLHIDRPLPFLCLHETGDGRGAAEEIATANAAYLITPDLAAHAGLIDGVAVAMIGRYGAFLIVEIAELAEDAPIADDAPHLPPFEIRVTVTPDAPTRAAADALIAALDAVDVKYRSPVVELDFAATEGRRLGIAFAPIYRQPSGDGEYPGLRRRVVRNIFDAVLAAAAAFVKSTDAMPLSTHRALGRAVYVDAVRKLDRQIDEVARSFDFLMAVTPINADAAWAEFQASNFRRPPRMLYRPLTIETDEKKRALFSIPFANLEDPLLHDIYREKQAELEMQLTLLDLRDTPRFRDASRLFYGGVDPSLLRAAKRILKVPKKTDDAGGGGRRGEVNCHDLREAAEAMIARYRAQWGGFDARVELRDDLPPGMMVSGPTLMISRATRISRGRVEALLSHEIGVHLLTWFTGDAQGLRLFRSGLAGYEGVQEGLAVFAEYLAGGLTRSRLRLIAGRVVGCDAMLDGADFTQTFDMLREDHGFSKAGAFGLSLRLHRSGGFAKDAIYLRGLFDILEHMAAGRPLDPFWMGKFATAQFPLVSELIARGLLRAPGVTPAFLSLDGARERLDRARAGLSPADLVSS